MKPLFIISFVLVWSISCFTSSRTKSNNETTQLTPMDEKCLGSDFQIQDLLSDTHAKPPFDNYFNISRALFPSEEISSTFVKIFVHFTNSSVDQEKFIWSRTCLYVSDRFLSLQAMAVHSLGAIVPSRREQDLHITLPTFCRPEDKERKLLYYLSTLEDIARSPGIIDPSLNSAECVVHAGKHTFKGWKQLFPYICWVILAFSLLGSNIISMTFSKHRKEVKQSFEVKVVKGLLWLLVFLCVLGFVCAVVSVVAIVIGIITNGTNVEQLSYPIVHLVVVIIALLCSCRICCKHERPFFRRIPVYPGWYIAFHHVLWIIIGVITEPFWAIPVLICWLLVAFAIHVLVFQWLLVNEKVKESPGKKWNKYTKFRFVCTILGVLLLAPFLITILLVGNQFFSETLIATVIPSVVFVILSLWFKGLIKTKQSSSAESNTIEASTMV